MKYLVLGLAILLAGCGQAPAAATKQSPYEQIDYRLTCIDGIVYILHGHGLAVKYATARKVETCYFEGKPNEK